MQPTVERCGEMQYCGAMVMSLQLATEILPWAWILNALTSDSKNERY
jgi:hypothetical protein